MSDMNTDLIYYSNLEKLLRAMTDLKGLDMESINAALGEMCKIFRVSKGVTRFYNSPQHEKQGKGEVFVCYDDGRGGEEVMFTRIVSDAMTVATCSVYMPAGETPLNEVERSRVELLQKTVLSFVSRNRLQRIVEKLTFYDDSGFRNLRYFFRYLEQIRQQDTLAGKVALHFNLKHFTLVNQEVGRNAGNLVIRNFFDQLDKIVADRGVVVRIGGDNFAMLFTRDRLEQVIAFLRGTPIVYDVNSGKRIMVSASVGVFEIPENRDDVEPDEIMDKIVATSQAARSGGNEDVVYYNSALAASKEKVMRVQRLLPEALAREEFQVYYQPKINIENGELAGAEALCRWYHDGHLVPPMDFIPLLEQSTDICKLDFYMLDHVCLDIRRWLDEGREVVRVSVNLSRKHMIDADLLEHIIEIIDRNQVPHKYIEIELTETTTDVEFRDLKRVVSGLQQAGIYTSVDDFGMGYSSLNLIRAIPWNVLKVDRSFLPLEEDDRGSTRSIMFKYVVAMAREMGLECIAEGVETHSQVEILKENECELAQGFYFDRPLPVNDFEDRLSTHRYDVA